MPSHNHHPLRRSPRLSIELQPLQILPPSKSKPPLLLTSSSSSSPPSPWFPLPQCHSTSPVKIGSKLSPTKSLLLTSSSFQPRKSPGFSDPQCQSKSSERTKRKLVDSEETPVRLSPRLSSGDSRRKSMGVDVSGKTPTIGLRSNGSKPLLLTPSSFQSRKSPRFSDPQCETISRVEHKSKRNLDDSEETSILHRTPSFSGDSTCIQSTDDSRRKSDNITENANSADTKSAKTRTMELKSKAMEEEKVMRRSPRGLASISLVDEYKCEEMKASALGISEKKKKESVKKVGKPKENSVTVNTEVDKKKKIKKNENCYFVGEPVPEEEARQRWGWRYQLLTKNTRVKSQSLAANAEDEDEPILRVKCHYTQAHIEGCIFNLGDCALVQGEGRQNHIGRILEFCQTEEEEDYFRVQWFYKAEDTVMKDEANFHDKKRIFYSTIMNDNLLDCIISKLNVVQVTPQLNLSSLSISPFDYYYDMEYCLEYSTFRNLPRDCSVKNYELSSLSSPESVLSLASTPVLEDISVCEPCTDGLMLLDLYAGCGAMSTGLCLGAGLAGVDLVTRWAIDCDSAACESLKLNHPGTEVKNVEAEDFLELLKQWEKLCNMYVSRDGETPIFSPTDMPDRAENSESICDDDISADELEVSSLVDISYGDTGVSGKQLKFKVRWKGYGPSDDTWEPFEGLSNCQELIREFVINGFNSKILPLPGDVDVLCGGPPCQGISGYNRFRHVDAPLTDERNRQLVIFMDIVEYLKPKFVLMENVTDILRFDKGSLGRYALSRLVHLNYQARVGIIAAGCYGLPQFRLRVFFWGALPNEELPQFPLPTHDVVVRYWPPPEFERNVVAYEEGQPPELEDAVFLRDAISDLPAVTNYESSDQIPYCGPPETEFQKYIRSTNHEMIGSLPQEQEAVLYDHRPHQLFEDDYMRVCQIPHRKGANFRDLPGVIVGDDNVVRRDPLKEPVRLPSGMPIVPEYAFTFEQGKSKRPFARLWWDETMATVVTYPNCHSQAVLHPEQDRVLTVRECARLQGFPDSYRFCGTVKKRYRQVGNAVAIPVAKALGYALGMASQKLIDKKPLITLPPKFAYS